MSGEETPLDAAFRAMEAAPDDLAARLLFHERLMDAELFVPLDAEAEEEPPRPQVFALDEGPFVLAFDRDLRLAAFLDAPAPYAALSGRGLMAALSGRGIGVALNPAVAPSQTLLTPEAVAWLAAMAAEAPARTSARARAVTPPRGAPAALIAALDTKLAAMAGLAPAAWLVTLELADGTPRLTLAVAGAPAAAEPGIAEAVAEAVRFCGAEGAELDVTFLGCGSPALAAIERVGLRFDPPAPPPPTPAAAPGSDPRRPPILR